VLADLDEKPAARCVEEVVPAEERLEAIHLVERGIGAVDVPQRNRPIEPDDGRVVVAEQDVVKRDDLLS